MIIYDIIPKPIKQNHATSLCSTPGKKRRLFLEPSTFLVQLQHQILQLLQPLFPLLHLLENAELWGISWVT